ncbi:MAG: hypothetical protein M1827_006363 [Pycnora praestabilis]|nr:MAG: hypothetical protein M1827_006363 [Pycnora praestabilis]
MSTILILSSVEREQVRLFERQCLQMLDPAALAIPSSEVLRNVSVQDCLYERMFKAGKLEHALPQRYRLRVLKRLTASIEEAILDPEEDEVSDDLMSCLAELLASSLPPEAISAQQKSYITYTMPTPLDTTCEETRAVILLEARSVIAASGTTGLRTWEAALHLGTYLSSAAGVHHIKGKSVLELGAGTGFLSILCAKHLEAVQTVGTDGDDGVVEDMGTNASLNGLDGVTPMSITVLRWGWTLMGTKVEERGAGFPFDVVLGADVTYDASVIPALVSTLRELFDKYPSIEAIISATIRNEATFEAFNKACRRLEDLFWLTPYSGRVLYDEDEESEFYRSQAGQLVVVRVEPVSAAEAPLSKTPATKTKVQAAPEEVLGDARICTTVLGNMDFRHRGVEDVGVMDIDMAGVLMAEKMILESQRRKNRARVAAKRETEDNMVQVWILMIRIMDVMDQEAVCLWAANMKNEVKMALAPVVIDDVVAAQRICLQNQRVRMMGAFHEIA